MFKHCEIFLKYRTVFKKLCGMASVPTQLTAFSLLKQYLAVKTLCIQSVERTQDKIQLR
jgi:hypothetical protein